MDNLHSGLDSSLGFYFQGVYALLVMLEQDSDAASIIIEGQDDLQLVGPNPTLFQLKHSLKSEPPPISIKSVQVWKTLKCWIDSSMNDHKLVLVTCSPILNGDLLEILANISKRDNLHTVVKALVKEAERVTKEREKSKKAKLQLPYKEKASGVEAFLKLTDTQKEALVRRIYITPNSINIKDTKARVSTFFRRVLAPNIRDIFIDNLLQWWDYRVCRSLIGELPKEITYIELFSKHKELISKIDSPLMHDSFGTKSPDNPMEIIGEFMKSQIDLVNGGPGRKRRAAIVWWKARHQREEWLSQDLSLQTRFMEFDELLEERWKERFDPMAYDFKDSNFTDCQKPGRDLLDWSHLDARNEMQLIENGSVGDYVVPGFYQQLAEELRIGWHRDWENVLKEEE